MNLKDNDAVIVSFARTPIGAYNGGLKTLSGPELGAHAIIGALKKLDGYFQDKTRDFVEECIMGNVISSGMGQGPARQACIFAELPYSVCCTTVNKVCSSGLKSIMLAAQQIQTGVRNKLVVAGGFESMSNIPYYLPDMRFGKRMQHGSVKDGMILDGLWDVYNDIHMGSCAELCAKEQKISRKDQDEWAVTSFKRAQLASQKGFFKKEIYPFSKQKLSFTKKATPLLAEDENIHKLDENKLPQLSAVFGLPKGLPDSASHQNTVTPGNASSLADGGAAVILCSAKFAREKNLPILSVVRSFADHEGRPECFPTAPEGATREALKRAGVDAREVSFFEFNEAFSAVVLANGRLLNISGNKVNIHGGAIALGHPLGMSGCRILMTLVNSLVESRQRYGCAAICNGGGGASAMVIENLQAAKY